MPKIGKAKKSKQEGKVEVQTKGKKEMRQKHPVQVKLEPDECTFTYRVVEKVDEAERNASGHKVMSVSEYVRSIRPELVPDIKPKIEPGIKQEPVVKEEPSNPDLDPKLNVINMEDDEVMDENILNGGLDTLPRGKQPNKKLDKKSTECLICHKTFRDFWALKAHGILHKEKTYKCNICDKLFVTQSKLNRHKEIHLLNRKMYSCNICQKEFKTIEGLRQHQKIHDLSRKLNEFCQICEMKFNSRNGLKRHIQTKHQGNEKKKCTFCDSQFGVDESLISHMRSEHFNLLRQQDKLTGDLHPIFLGRRTYECYRCKLSGGASTIKKHMRNCKGEKRVIMQTVECEVCGNRFSRKDGLKRHMRMMHSIDLSAEAMKNVQAERTHKCTFCDRSFIRRRELIGHMRTKHFSLLRKQDKLTGDLHSIFQGMRTYECHRCQTSTIFNLAALKRHMKCCINRPIKCKLCNKRFQNIVSIKNHLRHYHSMPYNKYKQMGKGANVEETERTFECIDCKLCFIQMHGLIRHIEMHCNKRVFKCDFCSRKFMRQTDKIDHHRHVHPTMWKTSHNEKFECHICKACMPVYLALKHLAEKHQKKTHFKLNIYRLK